jgi:hypothetical protein
VEGVPRLVMVLTCDLRALCKRSALALVVDIDKLSALLKF